MENLNKWEKNTSLLQFYLMPVNVQNMIYNRATPESPVVNKNDLITLFILLPPNIKVLIIHFLKLRKLDFSQIYSFRGTIRVIGYYNNFHFCLFHCL